MLNKATMANWSWRSCVKPYELKNNDILKLAKDGWNAASVAKQMKINELIKKNTKRSTLKNHLSNTVEKNVCKSMCKVHTEAYFTAAILAKSNR